VVLKRVAYFHGRSEITNVFGKIYVPNTDKISEKFTLLRNEELRESYRSADKVTVVASRRMQCAGYVGLMGEI
jgi:hypothetical protein